MSENKKSRKPKRNVTTEEVEVVETVETPVEEPVEQPVEEEVVVKKTSKEAVVSDCAMLNIRGNCKKDATVVAVISAGTEVIVDTCEAEGWYKVWLANGISGFCMKDYITIRNS